MKFLYYDLIDSYKNGVRQHPQEYMNEHYTVIHSVPQPIGDCWWFCVEDFQESLPSFLSEMDPYNLAYWRDGCSNNCEFFKKFQETHDYEYCCYGGADCLKEEK